MKIEKVKNCGECKYYSETHCKARAIEVFDDDIACDRFALKNETLFDRIIVSPEVLAPCFVEKQPDKWDDDDYPYYSYLTKEWYATEDKALAATVARLKEGAE